MSTDNLSDKKLEKLEKLLQIANEDYATPDDLIKMSEALLAIVVSEKDRLGSLIETTKGELNQAVVGALSKLSQKEQELKTLITGLKADTSKDISKATELLSKEIKRIERKIPTKTDLTGLERQIDEIRLGLNTLPTELTVNNEAIRDGLELLVGDERLDKSAIKGLDEKFDELEQANSKRETNFGFVIRDVQAGTGVTIDKTDPQRPIISSTGGTGSGDFLADGSVPMTGDLNLDGNDIINVNSIQFDTTPAVITPAEGLLQWNETDGTLNMGMDGGAITLQIGQEMFTKVRNNTGSTITNGSVVYFDGSLGNRPTIDLARSDATSTSMVQGVVTEDILDNDDGFVTTAGYVRQIKTDYSGSGIWGTTWVEGDLLYVSKTDAGVLTNVQPAVPHHSDIVGSVGVVGPVGTGSILVNIGRHTTLEDLSDVNGTALTTDGQIPVWDNTAGYLDFTENIFDRFDKTADDTDDISEGATNKFATAAEKTKLGFISVTQAVDLDALETASHVAVTVADSAEIDLTLTGQQISASIVAGSIDESKLDASVNASLDLADSASQPGHTHTASQITDFDTEVANNSAVVLNTAKVTNATHTGDVTGSGALTASPTMISGKGANAGLTGAEEVLINNGGTLEKTTTQDIADLAAPGGGSGITRTVTVTSGNVTAGSTALRDYVYFVAGAHTVSLPAASGNTNEYSIKNNHSANITIDTVGAETIEGAASISIAPEESVTIISDGTNYFII